jgi:magnesium-transporting ATPase (P-type)
MKSPVPSGLSTEEVALLREQYGQNILEEKKRTWWSKLRHWVYSPMPVMFLVAAVLSFVSGSTADGCRFQMALSGYIRRCQCSAFWALVIMPFKQLPT